MREAAESLTKPAAEPGGRGLDMMARIFRAEPLDGQDFNEASPRQAAGYPTALAEYLQGRRMSYIRSQECTFCHPEITQTRQAAGYRPLTNE